MVDEVIRIVITEQGARATSNRVRGIGSAAKTAAVAVTALVTALGAIAAVRGLTNLVRDSIRVSAQFEQLEVRLRGLLGSQEEANKALRTFVDLSSRTPFAVGQIVEGAATLAAVALGNRERLEELTATAANLAAITGLSFQEAAGNLQRALSAGIAAADLFRDRGVRGLIESIEGIPDATALSAAETEAAFLRVFGPGGTFGSAAEDLSNTLGGSLSNIDDALANTKDAIGDAFSPVVIQTARGVIIPFLKDLERVIRENEAEIRNLAGAGIRALLQGFSGAARAGLELVRVLARARQFIRSLQVGALELQKAAAGGPSGAGTRFRINREIERLLVEGRQAEIGLESLDRSIEGVASQLDNLDRLLAETSFTDLPDATQPDLPDFGGQERIDADAVAEREAAEERIATIRDRLRVAAAQQIDPLDAQLERLRQQRAELEEQIALSGETTAALEARRLLDEQVASIEAEKNTLLGDQIRLETELASLISQIERSSPELAEQLRAAAVAAIDAGGGLEQISSRLDSIRDQAQDVLQREQQRVGQLGEQIGQALGSGIQSTLRPLLRGEAVNFGEVLADTSSNLLDLALREVLMGLQTQLGKFLEGFGGGEGGTGGLGTALAAGLGGALALVAGAVRDTSAEISNGLARSSTVESVAATRGIVAGPQNIPILAVGESLGEAVEPIVQLLTEIRDLQRAGGGGTAALPSPASELQGTNSLI